MFGRKKLGVTCFFSGVSRTQYIKSRSSRVTYTGPELRAIGRMLSPNKTVVLQHIVRRRESAGQRSRPSHPRGVAIVVQSQHPSQRHAIIVISSQRQGRSRILLILYHHTTAESKETHTHTHRREETKRNQRERKNPVFKLYRPPPPVSQEVHAINARYGYCPHFRRPRNTTTAAVGVFSTKLHSSKTLTLQLNNQPRLRFLVCKTLHLHTSMGFILYLCTSSYVFSWAPSLHFFHYLVMIMPLAGALYCTPPTAKPIILCKLSCRTSTDITILLYKI